LREKKIDHITGPGDKKMLMTRRTNPGGKRRGKKTPPPLMIQKARIKDIDYRPYLLRIDMDAWRQLHKTLEFGGVGKWINEAIRQKLEGEHPRTFSRPAKLDRILRPEEDYHPFPLKIDMPLYRRMHEAGISWGKRKVWINTAIRERLEREATHG
jgi:hypothetical protein